MDKGHTKRREHTHDPGIRLHERPHEQLREAGERDRDPERVVGHGERRGCSSRIEPYHHAHHYHCRTSRVRYTDRSRKLYMALV